MVGNPGYAIIPFHFMKWSKQQVIFVVDFLKF